MNLDRRERGGAGGIRTLEGPFEALTPLAGERFRPLSHLSDGLGRERSREGAILAVAGRIRDLQVRTFASPVRNRLPYAILEPSRDGAEEKLPSGAHRLRLARFLVRLLALDPFVDFFAVHGNLARSIHAKAHLISLHAQDGHGDIVADDYRLPHSPGQDQHSQTPSWSLLPIPRSHSCTTRLRGTSSRPSVRGQRARRCFRKRSPSNVRG